MSQAGRSNPTGERAGWLNAAHKCDRTKNYQHAVQKRHSKGAHSREDCGVRAAAKHRPNLRDQYSTQPHRNSFAMFYLFAVSLDGTVCQKFEIACCKTSMQARFLTRLEVVG